MTTRTTQDPDNHDLEDSATPVRRAIPDGGLGAAMPAWLQETPDWKRSSEAAPARPIPDPDFAVIDPHRLIDVDDLPEWLRAVSTREPVNLAQGAAPPVPETPETTVSNVVSSTDTMAVAQGMPERAQVAAYPARDIDGDQDPIHLITASGDTGQPWWVSDAAVAVLFVAIILTMIYVILVATGVV